MIEESEVPANWGLIAIRSGIRSGGKTKIVKQAPIAEAKQIPNSMLASIFRNVNSTMVPESAVETMVKERVEEMRVRIEAGKDREHRRTREEYEKYKEFEKLSGVKIDTWRMGDIANAVKAVMSGDHYEKRLNDLKRDADNIAYQIARVLEPGAGEETTDAS